jgi:isopentenyl-diphosphate Delta-isomerase
MEEEVVLVDARDNAVGTAPKLQAHRSGLLHRAISVFVFDEAGRVLLQRRALDKYHSSGLWSNACCSHPRPGEQPHAAAIRRLQEEMGMSAPLEYCFSFIYKAQLDEGLWEHELDHVFIGSADADPTPQAAEVAEWRWVSPEVLEGELAAHPDRFTAWFPMAYEKLRDQLLEGATRVPW